MPLAPIRMQFVPGRQARHTGPSAPATDCRNSLGLHFDPDALLLAAVRKA